MPSLEDFVSSLRRFSIDAMSFEEIACVLDRSCFVFGSALVRVEVDI